MKYWINTGAKTHGSFTASQLKNLASTGKLKRKHKISTDQERWVFAESIKGLVFAAIESEMPRDEVTKVMKKAASGEEESWYCLINEKKVGAYSDREMKKMALAGILTLDTLVTTSVCWLPVSEIPNLKTIIEENPPPPKPLPTTCVFCAEKPRRKTVGICKYKMCRPDPAPLGSGSYSFPEMEAAREHASAYAAKYPPIYVPLPICSKCGQAMKRLTFFHSAFVLLLFASLVALGVVFAYGIDSTSGDKAAYIGLYVAMFVLFVLLVLDLVAVFAAIRMKTLFGPLFGLGNFILRPPFSKPFNPWRRYSPEKAKRQREDVRRQREEAIKGLGNDGDFTTIPDVYNLYLDGYCTGAAFRNFPGSFVTMNDDRGP